MPDGNIEECLAEITRLFACDDGKLALRLVLDQTKQNLWWKPSREELEELRAGFDVVCDGDLIGRECSVKYKESGCVGANHIFNSQIIGATPHIGYAESDFAEAV